MASSLQSDCFDEKHLECKKMSLSTLVSNTALTIERNGENDFWISTLRRPTHTVVVIQTAGRQGDTHTRNGQYQRARRYYVHT